MKKIRIIALLLTIVMLVGMLAGCGKSVSLKDIEADPRAAIEEALKLSFKTSPFGGLLDLKDPEATSVNFVVTPTDKDLGHIKLDTVFANKKLSALLKLDVAAEDIEVNGQLFLDAENFAVQFKELKEIFGTDSVGISLKDFEKTFKESAWYDLLIVQTGMEEELKNEGVDSIDLKAITDAYENYLNELKTMAESCQKYDISEKTIEIAGKKFKCYEVEETLSDDIVNGFEKSMKKFMQEVGTAINEEVPEDELNEMMDMMKKTLQGVIDSYTTTYAIDRKTGAIVKIESSMTYTPVEDQYSYPELDYEDFEDAQKRDMTTSYNFDVTFGPDPVKMFNPSFELTVKESDETTTVSGTSSIDKSEKAFVLDLVYDLKSDYSTEEYNYDSNITAKFTLKEDGTYKLSAKSDEEEVDFGGKFKVDGTKVDLTIDCSEIEDSEIGSIEIAIDFGAKIPTAFEYEDLMKWDEEKIMELMQKIQELTGSYDDYDDYDDYYEDYPVYDDIIIDNESNAA